MDKGWRWLDEQTQANTSDLCSHPGQHSDQSTELHQISTPQLSLEKHIVSCAVSLEFTWYSSNMRMSLSTYLQNDTDPNA
jgi:hypothetical protein